MDNTTARLASYATELRYEDLTPAAIHGVKRSVIDAFGCALGAFNAEPVGPLRAMASEITARRPATIFGTDIKTSPEMAGFVNGAMIRYSDFSDDYFGGDGTQAGPHPSDNVGSILAIAEALGRSGQDLIMGITLAYEGCNQLVDYVLLHPPHGWDYPILHSIGTALGAGKLLGLGFEQMGNALGLAIVPNVCLWQTRLGRLSNWKGLAGPNGSRNGLFAAQLAKQGITGPSDAFEGRAGFMKQLDSPFELQNLGGHGTPFKVEGTFFKALPVMYSLQLPIWAALDLRKQVKVEDIESIVVYVDSHVMEIDAFTPDRWDPKTRETADHSGPYLIAAAIIDGQVTEETMTPRRFRDPTILELMQRLRVVEEKAFCDYPQKLQCRIEAMLKSGTVVAVDQTNPKGHPANPLSDLEIEDKFLHQVGSRLTSSRSRQLIDTLWKLDFVTDLGAIFPIMKVDA